MGLFSYTWRVFSRECVLIVAAAAFFVPVYLLVTLSLKTPNELYLDPLSVPTDPHWSNYSDAWGGGGGVTIGQALINSSIITLGSVICLVTIGSVCAYAIARRPSRLSTTLYVLFLLGIIAPFQLGVVPIFVAMRSLGLVPSYVGMVLLNTGLLMPLAVFLYTGFVRSLPPEYEEAARVDGAGRLRTYVRVVFPLLGPVTGTVAVLSAVITWNEFFLPLVFLGGSDLQTLPVAVYSFVSEVITQWNLIFATVTVAIAPMIVFFLVAQRQLIRGFGGGVRG
jgi:raffinose/stachyose/melibiose transport system permease protein